MTETVLRSFAELIVHFAANVQPGQVVAITTGPGKEALTRAVADVAYRHGAKYVDLFYFDSYVKRSRIAHADEATLDWVPPWYAQRLYALEELGASRISFSPPTDPGALDGVDPARAGRDHLPFLKETLEVVNRRAINWTTAPCPIPAWAELVHPESDGKDSLARLWDDVVHICRLDEPDPVAAWRERMEQLAAMGDRLSSRRFDALHFEGPGTDLTVGLFPSSCYITASFSRADGLRHLVNLPSEEIFTTPDPARADGVVRSTRPLALGGTVVRGLTVRFEGGRAVEIQAAAGAEALRAYAGRDEGACRLGEVALVDRESRIGQLGRTFYDTLLDENAASHIALGSAYSFGVEDAADVARVNKSEIHVDFMIGGDDVSVTGITADGDRLPVLRDGRWQL